jgi:hypothetical protein
VALHVDHVVPVSLGGTNGASNLVTACSACNHGKGPVPLSADPAPTDRAAERLAKGRCPVHGLGMSQVAHFIGATTLVACPRCHCVWRAASGGTIIGGASEEDLRTWGIAS